MHMRTMRERVFQTIYFEVLGLIIVVPIYSRVFDTTSAHGFTVIASLSLAVMFWTPLHNALFDYFDWHLNRRLASDRTRPLRVAHAMSQELTCILITLPLLLWLGNLTPTEALLTDLGLTLFYTVYTYAFYVCYDRWRPIGRASVYALPTRKCLDSFKP